MARSILVIICTCWPTPTARYTDLGHGYHQARTDTKLNNRIRQIEALGFSVTLSKAS